MDLSPEDVNFSKHYVFNNQKIFCCNALDYLFNKENRYDLIISKAVLEHILKSDINKFLTFIHKSLKNQGRVIIYVPNMDWIMSQHERYMDLTHEVGFTRESLGELLRLYFNDVNISPFYYGSPFSVKSKIAFKVMKPMLIKLTRLWLKILGEGAGDCWFEYRAIVGTGIKNKS